MTLNQQLKFTGTRDDLLSGKKIQTIRMGYGKWGRRLARSSLVDVVWIPEGEEPEILFTAEATMKRERGYEFDARNVVRCGDSDMDELQADLMDVYGISKDALLFRRWAVIDFKRVEDVK